MPSFSVLPGPEGFLLSVPRWSPTVNPSRPRARETKDQRMFKCSRWVLALAGTLVSANIQAQFATTVSLYTPGTGFSPGYTNASVVLGAPSSIIPGPFGGPVDPFNPPYLNSQILSIGAGGSLTVTFEKPVMNHPKNRFGIDFIVFGNSGFIITNAFDPNTFDWIGTPATDGSLFAHNPDSTRVWVSRDGESFYLLDPNLAPTVDGLCPTDGEGNCQIPVDPALTQADFAGLTVEAMRAFYLGSAGGAGFDISWALDANGNPVHLSQISHVRIEVLSGKSEVDGFAVVFAPWALSR